MSELNKELKVKDTNLQLKDLPIEYYHTYVDEQNGFSDLDFSYTCKKSGLAHVELRVLTRCFY